MRPAAETESGRVVRRKERKRKREKRRGICIGFLEDRFI
jgi:hypothetical protein